MKFTRKTFLYIFVTFLAFVVFLIPKSNIFATTAENVFGYAWNDNIGWISFNNCTNPADSTTCSSPDYGVNIKSVVANGVVYKDIISGTAWNDNVGWISFDPLYWGACPPGVTSCSINSWSNNSWGRVMSQTGSNTGGWDGWISLSNTSYSNYHSSIAWTDISSKIPSSFGSFYSRQVYAMSPVSYGWGGDTLGWVDFNHDSTYDPRKGGVYFLSDISPFANLTFKGYSTYQPKTKTIVAGDKVSFDWGAGNGLGGGFTTTSCTGADGTTTSKPFATDWTGKSFSGGTSGSISNINVRYDTSNKALITDFVLSCTDGKTTIKSNPASVTVIPLTATLTLNNISSCVDSTSSIKPEFNWSSNSSNAICKIKATPSSGSSYMITPTMKTVVDNLFSIASAPTTYVLMCENGDGVSQSKVAVSSSDVKVSVCPPSFDVKSSSSCTGASTPGADLTADGKGNYVGTVSLKISPHSGFNSDVSLILAATNGSGTPAFVPSSGSYLAYPYKDEANLVLSLTASDFNNAIKNTSSTLPSGVLNESTIIASPSNSSYLPKNITVDFCNGTAKKDKIIYTPF